MGAGTRRLAILRTSTQGSTASSESCTVSAKDSNTSVVARLSGHIYASRRRSTACRLEIGKPAGRNGTTVSIVS